MDLRQCFDSVAGSTKKLICSMGVNGYFFATKKRNGRTVASALPQSTCLEILETARGGAFCTVRNRNLYPFAIGAEKIIGDAWELEECRRAMEGIRDGEVCTKRGGSRSYYKTHIEDGEVVSGRFDTLDACLLD